MAPTTRSVHRVLTINFRLTLQRMCSTAQIYAANETGLGHYTSDAGSVQTGACFHGPDLLILVRALAAESRQLAHSSSQIYPCHSLRYRVGPVSYHCN